MTRVPSPSSFSDDHEQRAEAAIARLIQLLALQTARELHGGARADKEMELNGKSQADKN